MEKKVVFAAIYAAMTVFAADKISTADERTGINLTVYNDNRALVQEKRKIMLDKGISNVRFESVAQEIIPQSLIVVSNGSFNILEQNYEFDLISKAKLIEKFVGKEITLIDEDGLFGNEKHTAAKIVAGNFTNPYISSVQPEGAPIFDVGGKILLGFDGKILLPEIPENLYAKPTLNWKVAAPKAGDVLADVSYMTRGFNWNADYVLLLADNDKSAAITAWITLTNQSGAAFEDVNLQLMAGDVNMVRNEQLVKRAGAAFIGAAKEMAYDAAAVEEKAFDEYHLYKINGKVSVRENQTKQIEMFAVENIKTAKKYRVNLGGSYVPRSASANDKGAPQKVSSEIVFETGKRNNLDLPFPKGVVRIYKKDGENNIFIGEDRINHTPIDEEITLKSGDAFDITCFEKKTADRRISDKKSEYDKEVSLSNHKKESVEVIVDENLWDKWTIKSDTKHEKVNANTARFKVALPAGKEVVLKFSATIER